LNDERPLLNDQQRIELFLFSAILPKFIQFLCVKFAKHKNFDSFLGALPLLKQSICLKIRNLILGNFPEMRETWHCWKYCTRLGY